MGDKGIEPLTFRVWSERSTTELVARILTQWTYRESNPDLFHAMEPFYRYTIGPSEKKSEACLCIYFERRAFIEDIGPDC